MEEETKMPSFQLLSCVRLFVTPWIAACQASLSITSLSILEFIQTHVHRVSDAIQPSHPLSSLLLLPTILPSISLFQWVNSSHEVAKVLELTLASVLPKNTQDWSPLEWTGWISLRQIRRKLWVIFTVVYLCEIRECSLSCGEVTTCHSMFSSQWILEVVHH